MEIDTGSSVPLAQSSYTLPLKDYNWVRNKIETLEKAGVIERSLSLWVSPVIVVPKKLHRINHHAEDFGNECRTNVI